MRKLHSQSSIRVGAVGALLAMTLTACGSGSGSEGSGGSGGKLDPDITATASPKPTGTPIKIGMLVDLTGGPAAEKKDSAGVAKAWVKWTNETQGGVNGHPIELIVKDVQSQTATAAREARDMVSQGVAAVIAQSGVAGGAIEPYLDEQGVPLLTMNDGTLPPKVPDTVFTTDIGYPNEAKAAAVLAKAAGLDSMMATVCAEFPACAAIGKTLEEYAPSIGIDYKGTITLPLDATSATAQCLQVSRANADLVVAFLIMQPTTKLATTCQTQGFKGSFAIYANRQANLDLLTPPTYGVLIDFPWWSDADPVVEYRSVVEAFGDDVDYRGYTSANTWTLLKLFDLAMTSSGPAADAEVTGADVIAAYRAGVKDETLDGLLPQPIMFS